MILPPGQCLILIWSPSELPTLSAVSCPLPHFCAHLGLQNLCLMSVRKLQPIARCGYFNPHKVSKNHIVEEK